MKLSDIANIRLISQQIAETKFKTPKEVVNWMGAMQAQDYNMAKWAIGIRLADPNLNLIETAIEKGEIIRTHLLRPTWHFVSAEDTYWMLGLTAPRIKASMKSRNKELELTESIFRKSNTILRKALTANDQLTREELMTELKKAKIKVDNNRSSHLLLEAEMDGIICSGATKNNKQTYALLEKRVPQMKPLKREEALAKLAHTYFSSHCPATLQDFTWWSGLSVTEARQALEMIKKDFVAETTGSQAYWFPNSFPVSATGNKSIYLLPAYDEFIISYKDRTASLHPAHHKKSIFENGLFKPVIVMKGQVTGLWKRSIVKDKVIMETAFFRPHNKTQRKLIGKAAERFGRFLNRKTELIINE